ncbi:MAG: Gar1/Naf1 family protein [Methanobrevibacter sp.]|jgi:RNA-binding protein|nr:Gar1/Naf1 family protein [Candidatus Methanovirga basalitermitum]
MKFIGNIVHLANSGKLIGRSSQSPPIGVAVYNKKKNKIGKIYNVFGSTRNPYVSIVLKVKNFKYNVNDELYISKSSKDKRRKKLRKKK